MVLGMGCAELHAQVGVKSGGEPCDQGARNSVAAALQAQKDLVGQPVKDMDTEVAPAMRTQIAGFKDTLVAATDAVMRCEPANATAEQLQKDLVGQFHANQPESPVADPFRYGANLQVKVSTAAAEPSLRIVELRFQIECGEDTVLLVYEPVRRSSQVMSVSGAHVDSGTAVGLVRTLRWQAAPYEEISGAFGNFFEYVVLPGQDGKPWRLVVAHGTDWCTSRWSGYKIDLIEPQAGAVRLVWHDQQGYVREDDPRLIARPNGFELRLDVGTIESEQMVRKGVFRYVVDGDTVRRVGPIAVDGRGFVDAWLQSPWSEAKQWSVPEGLDGFEKAHEAFARGRKDANVTYSYGPVRGCLMKGQYEVEIDADPGGKQFYAIREGPNGYAMVNFGTTQDERCGGADLMRKK
jgi:hypothetical protein